MTREERDWIDGTLTPRVRDRIAEAYRTADASYCRKWEEQQLRQAIAREYVEVPGLGKRFRAAGFTAMDVAELGVAGESTVRRALKRDLYSHAVLEAVQRKLAEVGSLDPHP